MTEKEQLTEARTAYLDLMSVRNRPYSSPARSVGRDICDSVQRDRQPAA